MPDYICVNQLQKDHEHSCPVVPLQYSSLIALSTLFEIRVQIRPLRSCKSLIKRERERVGMRRKKSTGLFLTVCHVTSCRKTWSWSCVISGNETRVCYLVRIPIHQILYNSWILRQFEHFGTVEDSLDGVSLIAENCIKPSLSN